MINVNNRRAIRQLADNSFRANRLRNMIAVIAIALTAVLFTTLFTMGICTIDIMQKASLRQAGGDGHAVLKYITDQEFERVKDHPLIKEIAYNRILCDDVKNKEFLKRRAEFWYYDDVGLKLGFCQLSHGNKPKAENEVIADSKTLQLLGVPLKVGAPLTLNLKIRGQEVQRSFILAGWWESDPVFNIGQIFSSRAYIDAHPEELKNTYKTDNSLTGTICASIMFKNSLDLEGKLKAVIEDSGYSLDEKAPNYIQNNVNWAYLSSNFGMDSGSLIALLSALLLIVLTGYLIIYNIFQISVIRDIRFYGLLKTIGTTGRQIRRIIRRQAMILALIGIPLGLISGFYIGKSLVPLLVNRSSFAGTTISASPNPWIFVGAALFAYITVLISTFKPGRIAASVSPVEASRYTEGDQKSKKKRKNSVDGSKMPRMALANVGREPRRTVLVLISLSLSLVLLNTVFTLSQSIDIDKFMQKFNDTDFMIAHADYFQNHFSGSQNAVTESFIQAVQAQPGFEDGGRLYGGREECFAVEDKKNTTQKYNINPHGHFMASVYGLEDLPLKRLTMLDGELDIAKLASGKYILEGVELDDNEVAQMNTAHFAVGDKVVLHNYKGSSDDIAGREYTTQVFTVMGHAAIKAYSNSDRCGSIYNFYLPAQVYKTLVTQPAVMSYAFNVAAQDEAGMEKYLKNYTDSVEPVMNYTSKFSTRDDFNGMRSTVVMVGGALSFIIGLIGILNFINAILTSILTRRKEFAMLQSIGMTRKQLQRMLMFEGFYYVFGTSILALVLGIVFSLLIVKYFCSLLWFFSYHFILWPLWLVLPFLLLLGIMIPWLAYAITDKQSIVERLREAE